MKFLISSAVSAGSSSRSLSKSLSLVGADKAALREAVFGCVCVNCGGEWAGSWSLSESTSKFLFDSYVTRKMHMDGLDQVKIVVDTNHFTSRSSGLCTITIGRVGGI